jgi:hypothetical protein
MEMLATINSETLCSISCSHKIYGSGQITKIKCSENNSKPELFLTFESPVKSTVFAYTIASKFLQFDETDALTLDSLMAEYLENWLEFDANRKAEAQAAHEAKAEAEAKAKADKEAAQKLEAAMAKLNKLQPEDVAAVCGTPQTEYETIGWLAKHCTGIKPSMPAEACGWFEKKFGKVDNAKVYEAGAKTTGGNSMKYTLSIEGSFNSEVPSILSRFVSDKNPKHISSVEFFWTLVDKYGFQFGKKQNVDEIKKFVPADYLPDFDRGLAM